MSGTIILLNGTSSSGKSSIVQALQVLLDEPYLDAGMDRFLTMLPSRYLHRPLWDDVLGLATEAGAVGLRLVSGMHYAIAALSRCGNNVIVDHVLVEPVWLIECFQLLYDLPAYFVGVRCPLDVVERREKQRADRTLGQARAQFELVHRHALYDLEVDSADLSPLECAQCILRRIKCGGSPTALRQLYRRHTQGA